MKICAHACIYVFVSVNTYGIVPQSPGHSAALGGQLAHWDRPSQHPNADPTGGYAEAGLICHILLVGEACIYGEQTQRCVYENGKDKCMEAICSMSEAASAERRSRLHWR